MSQKALLFCFTALASTFTSQAAETDTDKLYAALHAGNLSELKALLDRGISANAADSRLITPLMYAAIVGSADAIRILIEHGADVNAQNAFGSTALMWSASDAQKVRLLLDHGADVNKISKSGRTALTLVNRRFTAADATIHDGKRRAKGLRFVSVPVQTSAVAITGNSLVPDRFVQVGHQS